MATSRLAADGRRADRGSSPVIHRNAFLPGDKGEIRAEFEDERLEFPQDRLLHVAFAVSPRQSEKIEKIRIVKDQVGR